MLFLDSGWVAVSAISTLITGVATLLLAIVTIRMVNEIKKQRKSSYQPDLFVGNQQVFFIARSIGGKTAIVDFANFSYANAVYSINRTYSASVLLFNGGFAMAKKVEYRWSFDLQEMISQIKKLDRQDDYHFVAKKMLLFTYRGQEIIAVPLVSSREPLLYGQILPSSVDKISQSIRIPTAYLILVAAFIRLSDQVVNLDNLPALKLSLWYQDIEKTQFSKQFSLSFELGPFQVNVADNSFEGIQEVGSHNLMCSEVQDV